PVVGDEHVVEDDDAGRLAVPAGEGGRLLPRATGRTGDDRHAGGVDGNGAAHSEVGVVGRHRPAGHHQELVDVGRAGDDGLGAADDDAVGAALGDVDVDVGVGLLAGALRAVA